MEAINKVTFKQRLQGYNARGSFPIAICCQPFLQ